MKRMHRIISPFLVWMLSVSMLPVSALALDLPELDVLAAVVEAVGAGEAVEEESADIESPEEIPEPEATEAPVEVTGKEYLVAEVEQESDVLLAYSGTCGDNLTWTMSDDGVLTITGNGAMTDYSNSSRAPWYDNRASIAKVIIGDSVTSIGKYAFYGCRSLTSVTIPDSITTIGNSAFYWCTSLTNVTIGDSVTTIGYNAFQGCTSLMSVSIGDSVTSIGHHAFSGCGSLTSVTIPNSVTSIENYAFWGCDSLTSVTIPASVTSIGEEAFRDCDSLTSITVENPECGIYDHKNTLGIPGTTTIYGHSGSTAETFADSYDYDFVPLDAVASGTCGENLTWILTADGVLTISGTGAMKNYGYPSYAPWYNNRSSVTAVIIEKGVTTIGGDAFHDCAGLTCVTIGDSVTTIGKSAFYDCHNLTSVTIGDSVTTIGDYAFYVCPSLTNVTIPDSVTTIGDYTFYLCSSLTNVTIPASVTSIGSSAFGQCSKLTSITVENPKCEIYDDESTLGIPGTTTVYGYSGSTAESFADMYDYDFVPLNAVDFGTCGNNLKWMLSDDGVLTISGTGAMEDYNPSDPAPWYDACSFITAVIVENSVTTIGSCAFEYCTSLTNVTVPDGVTTIGASAFRGCTSLTSVTIPDSVTTIGAYAVYDCDSLMSVTIPDSVTTIGGGAFSGCGSLEHVLYIGTRDDWADISIGRNNTALTSSAPCFGEEGDAFTAGEDCVSTWMLCPVCEERFAVVTKEGGAHSYGEWVETTAASCTEDGSKRRDCENCDYYETDGITAPGHTEVVDKAVAATCTKSGLTKGKHCSVCGTVTVAQKEVAATGHKTELKNVVEATCTKGGYTGDRVCIVCNKTTAYGQEVEATGHTEVVDAAVAATCTTTGLTKGSHCAVCNAVIVTQREVEVLEHTWDVGMVTKEPALNVDGVKTYTCSGCGGTKTETIPAISVDVSGDGETNALDLVALMKHLIGAETAANKEALDVNGDGGVNILDVIRLIRYLA